MPVRGVCRTDNRGVYEKKESHQVCLDWILGRYNPHVVLVRNSPLRVPLEPPSDPWWSTDHTLRTSGLIQFRDL